MSSPVSSSWVLGTLPAIWEPGIYEAQIYQQWVRQGYFTADRTSNKPAFSIIMPPPNVNGNLHSGHAFEHTVGDIICRTKRAQGYDVLWLPGTDHAGIAVQIAVEKELVNNDITPADMSREDFVFYCYEFADRVRKNIVKQIQAIGVSADWSRLRFSLDDQLSTAVCAIFKLLYDAGFIYRGERLVNWSPMLGSAISDLEVDYKEVEGELISFRYGFDENNIIVATTRIETILGDTAIAVHPDDERYQHLIGKQIAHPFLKRTIPVIGDVEVAKDFGTGAVKITPAHDPFDFELAARHGLELITVIDRSGKICNTGTEFDGLDRFEAREKIREALRAQGRITQEIRPYIHSVGHSERSGEPLEPLVSLQWWVKTEELAKSSSQAIRDGETVIYPQSQNARWFDWVDNMRDWCISRQQWWGHRIPVWYGPEGQILVPGPDDVIPEGYVQDEDVLDTWFSSGLFPFATLGWPHNTEDLQRYYPTTLMNTGSDLIFFWVARMMMFARFIAGKVPGAQPILPDIGDVPFKEVFFHGLVRDEYGAKMSKSKGNGVDPMLFIEQFGVDAARFTFARAANPGSDLNLGNSLGELSRNFITKIFNATKFAITNGATVSIELERLTTADYWILQKLSDTIVRITQDCAQYQLGRASDVLYHFAWDDVCDWYIECAKAQLKGPHADNTRKVLGIVFDNLLRLLHPFTPFVTEILWLALQSGDGQRSSKYDSIVLAPWPDYSADFSQHGTIFDDMQRVITEIRRFRNDQGIKSSVHIPVQFRGANFPDDAMELIIALAKISVDFRSDFNSSANIEVCLSQGVVSIDVDTSDAIDKSAERAKLEKELAGAIKDLTHSQERLANTDFIAKAPAQVVEKIRQRAISAAGEVERITQRLASL